MNQPARVTVADLRLAVLALSPLLGGRGPAALAPFVANYQGLLRRLNRAADCPDLDNLADALAAADELQAAVESVQTHQPVVGIARLRKGFAAIEAWVDGVELAEPGQESRPDATLDIPVLGPLALLLARRASSTTLVAAPRTHATLALPELRRAA